MEEIKIIFTDGSSLEFTGEYIGEINPQGVKTENWKYYREINGKIHHIKKENIFRVESIETDVGFLRFNNCKYMLNKKNQQPYKVLSNEIINATNEQDGQLMIIYKDMRGDLYVREENEFNEKFTDVTKDE